MNVKAVGLANRTTYLVTRSGFPKSEFYDTFHQVRPVVFNTRNFQEHQRKRKYINPAFSARALSKFEPYMDEELCKWKQKIFEMTEEPKPVVVDMVTWSKWCPHSFFRSK